MVKGILLSLFILFSTDLIGAVGYSSLAMAMSDFEDSGGQAGSAGAGSAAAGWEVHEDHRLYVEEVAALRAAYGAESEVVVNAESKAIAPRVTELIESMALDIAGKLSCQVPPLRILLSQRVESYGASATFSTEKTLLKAERIYEKFPDGSRVLRQERSVFSTRTSVWIAMGAGRILLTSQYKHQLQFLYATLAHEFGHVILDHSKHDFSPEQERAADEVALGVVGDPDVMIQALEMGQISAHLFHVLTTGLGLSGEWPHAIINNVLPRLNLEFPFFGKLGQRSSICYSRVVMLKMLERDVKKDLLAGRFSFEDICQTIYDCLKLCCQSPREAFPGLHDSHISKFCAAVDRLSVSCVQSYLEQLDHVPVCCFDSFLCKINHARCEKFEKTHPGPKSRACYIRRAFGGCLS